MKITRFTSIVGCFLICSVTVQAMGKKPPVNGLIMNSTLVYDLETGRKRIVTKPQPPWDYGTAYISPDGKRLLFAATISDKNGTPLREEIRTIGMDGENERMWYFGQLLRTFGWSPDGRFIFTEVIAPPWGQVLYIDTTTEEAWLVNISEEYLGPGNPPWSADGKSLYFVPAHRPNNEWYPIVKIDLTGKNPRPFMNVPADASATISPDEKSAALVTSTDKNLYLMDIATGEIRLTRRTREQEFNAFWSPDGKWVGIRQITSATMEPSKIYLVNAETGKWQFFKRDHAMGLFSWWQPPTGPLPDCGKIVREQLGPGRPLKEILETLSPQKVSAQEPNAN